MTSRVMEAQAPPTSQPSRGTRAFMSGAMAGMFTSVVLQPFDVVKTRLQARAVVSAAPRGMIHMAQSIVQGEGVRALWSGVGPACLRVGGGAGLYFLCLSSAQKVLDERWPRDEEGKPALPALRTFSLGAFSRATAAVVFCPITVVKTRMEYGAVSGVRYRNTLHALVTIGRQERLRGLFSGLGPTLLRDAPYSGLYLVMFTHLRDRLDAAGYSGSPHLSFLAGALAGSLATFATHPPDVVRTRLQLRHNLSLGGGGGGGGGVPPPPLPTSYAAIVRQEGLRALWTGVTPRIARRTLQQGMTWTIFEWFFGGRIA